MQHPSEYTPDTVPADFVSLTMPVREDPWRWPRDLHSFFRQNLPEGYLLDVIREEFGPLHKEIDARGKTRRPRAFSRYHRQ